MMRFSENSAKKLAKQFMISTAVLYVAIIVVLSVLGHIIPAVFCAVVIGGFGTLVYVMDRKQVPAKR